MTRFKVVVYAVCIALIPFILAQEDGADDVADADATESPEPTSPLTTLSRPTETTTQFVRTPKPTAFRDRAAAAGAVSGLPQKVNSSQTTSSTKAKEPPRSKWMTQSPLREVPVQATGKTSVKASVLTTASTVKSSSKSWRTTPASETSTTTTETPTTTEKESTTAEEQTTAEEKEGTTEGSVQDQDNKQENTDEAESIASFPREPKMQSDQNINRASSPDQSLFAKTEKISPPVTNQEKGQFMGSSEFGDEVTSGAADSASISEDATETTTVTTMPATSILTTTALEQSQQKPSSRRKAPLSAAEAKSIMGSPDATAATSATRQKRILIESTTVTTTPVSFETTHYPKSIANLEETPSDEEYDDSTDAPTDTTTVTTVWTPKKRSSKAATTTPATTSTQGRTTTHTVPTTKTRATTTAAVKTTLPDSEYYDDPEETSLSLASIITTITTTKPTTITKPTTTSKATTTTTARTTNTTKASTTTRTTLKTTVKQSVADKNAIREHKSIRVADDNQLGSGSEKSAPPSVAPKKNFAAEPIVNLQLEGNASEALLDGSYLSDPWMCRVKKGVVKAPVMMETCTGGKREVVDLRVYKLVGIPTEECVTTPVALGDRCTSLNGGKARCAQRYVRYGLIAKDTPSDKKGHECFRFPSACLCQLMVDGQTLVDEPDHVAKEP